MDVFLAFVSGLGVGLVLLAVIMARSSLRRHADLKKARAESVRQSGRVIRGRIAEQLAPLLPGFEYAPSDAKFLGDPIDYVVFHGLGDLRAGHVDPESIEVVLLDVKHGRSELSPHQRAVAGAVAAGRVRFRLVRISEDHAVTTEDYRPRKRGAPAGS